MTDTARTITAALALFQPESSFVPESGAVGATPSITPQDLRDIIKSLTPSVGALYFSSAAATSVATQSVALKAAGTTAALGTATSDITVATTNRLTYTGTPTRTFLVMASANITCAADAKLLRMHVASGGTVVTGAFVEWTQILGATVYAVSCVALVSLATNGYVEIFLSNETDAEDMTVQDGQLVAIGLPT